MPNDPLFEPLALGDLTLPNRIIMAPLTRCRASEGHVPSALNAEYYAQRAGAGLILSEATCINADGIGYPDTPGIWSDAQVEGWQRVTDAVHEAGGQIVCQLWHVGRYSHPMYLDGRTPLAPSAIKPEGHVSLVRPKTEFVTPQAMTLEQIQQTMADYRRAALNAKQAGFGGVELHAANGYLPDQFMQDSSNQRTDAYGGPIASRVRFMLEATDTLIDVWGPGRVGVHLAPQCDAHNMGDSDPDALFTYVAEQLDQRGIAFICTREGNMPEPRTALIRSKFKGRIIGNQAYDGGAAREALEKNEVDAVAFGRYFIGHPDLPERLKINAELAYPDEAAFYPQGNPDFTQGYTDFPTLSETRTD